MESACLVSYHINDMSPPESFKTVAVGWALSKLRVVRWDDGIHDLGSCDGELSFF
jgi:hypothetical protein